MTMQFLIWSNEHRQWWNPKSLGYTSVIGRAGRYSEKEAISICNGANYVPTTGKPVINEAMVPTMETFEAVRTALIDARNQLEYLEEHFPTGSTLTVVARINAVLEQ